MKHKIVYFIVYLFTRLIALLPLRLGVMVGSLLGDLAYWMDSKHRQRAMEHLQRAFGHEKNPQQLNQIARDSYKNMGRSLVESIYLPNLTASAMQRWVAVDGLSHYIEAHHQKKGVIILTAHFGNWEIIPKLLWSYGHCIHATVRPLDNPYLDQMVQDWRRKNGMGVLNKRTDVHRILKLLREGESVGFLMDQNTVIQDAVFVDFFGHPAATNKGLAILALRSGAPVIPIFMVREQLGHRMIIEKPIQIVRSGGNQENILKTTALFTQTIESFVARYPAEWFWVHRRWKTQRGQGPQPTTHPVGMGKDNEF